MRSPPPHLHRRSTWVWVSHTVGTSCPWLCQPYSQGVPEFSAFIIRSDACMRTDTCVPWFYGAANRAQQMCCFYRHKRIFSFWHYFQLCVCLWEVSPVTRRAQRECQIPWRWAMWCGTRTWVLFKSSKCSQPLISPQPVYYFFLIVPSGSIKLFPYPQMN